MKAFNKSILILFMSLIVLSLALTSVAAEDVNDISTTSISNYDSVSEDIDSVGESEVKSFEELQKLIDENTNGTIDLDCDYRYMGITNGVFSDKNITINGNGHTLDGANQSRIFHLSGANVYIYNINFINANATSSKWSTSGGAVYGHNGNFTIANCNFTNNYGSSGGALGTASWLYSNFTVINCNFTNNSASTGGAVYARNIDLINSSFINNYAGYAGAFYSNSYSHDNIFNSTFINNSASSGGAIVYLYTLQIFNSTFINNSATSEGGAINAGWDDLILNNCSLINNTASRGGAIYADGYSVIAINSTFMNNYANNSGGDIYSYWIMDIGDYFAHITFINSSSINSKAKTSGGSVYTLGGLSSINSTFFNNSASRGGSFYLDRYGSDFEEFVFINNSTFINNNATQGGVLMSRNSDLSDALVNNSKFINNSATSSGGTIYMNIPMGVEFSTFINNSAKSGGALYLGRDSVVQYSIFDNNSATTGRDIYSSNSVNSLFNNNYWSMNFTSVDEFINANLVANRTSAIVPDNWVLMNIYVDPELKVGTNSSVAVKFDKVTDGSTISDFGGVLPDYSTNIYMLTMKEDEEYNHKWDDENHNISRVMDTLVLHENEAKYGFVVDAPGMYNFYTHSPFTVWEESVKVGVAALQPNMTVQVITLDPQVYVNDTASFEVVVKNNGECGLSTICIDESSFDDLVFDSWSSDDAWIYSFEDGVHKWTLDDILDVNETTSFVLVFNTTAVGNKTISVVGSSVNENIFDKVADNVTEVIKRNGSFVVSVDDITYGDNFTIEVTDAVGDDGELLNGTVIVTINDVEYEVVIVNGTGSKVVSDILPVGEYPVNASLTIPNYNVMEANTTFTVSKINTTVTVDPVKGEVGEKVNITAKVTDQNGNPVPNGTVIIKFDGKEYKVDVVDGIATVEVVLPNAGNYSATAYYEESDKYYSSNTVFTVEVSEVPKHKLNTTVTVDSVKGEVGEKVNITAKVTDENGNPVPNGTVIIKFDGKEYKVDVVDGVATVEVVLPNAGNYSATAYYEESDKYYSSNTVFTVEVSEVPGPNPDPKPTPINNGNMENTGNPLLVLLIALGMIGIESLRRKF